MRTLHSDDQLSAVRKQHSCIPQPQAGTSLAQLCYFKMDSADMMRILQLY
jgi:hypothetical protein